MNKRLDAEAMGEQIREHQARRHPVKFALSELDWPFVHLWGHREITYAYAQRLADWFISGGPIPRKAVQEEALAAIAAREAASRLAVIRR